LGNHATGSVNMGLTPQPPYYPDLEIERLSGESIEGNPVECV